MTDILTEAQVAEIAERARRATEGPWKWFRQTIRFRIERRRELGVAETFGTSLSDAQDAEFIAESRTDTPALCASHEELRVQLKVALARVKKAERELAEADAIIVFFSESVFSTPSNEAMCAAAVARHRARQAVAKEPKP